tara:strand:- start:1349 stop:1498 length:150 start_codon:yes stop_codon:yes gene_type:complete
MLVSATISVFETIKYSNENYYQQIQGGNVTLIRFKVPLERPKDAVSVFI